MMKMFLIDADVDFFSKRDHIDGGLIEEFAYYPDSTASAKNYSFFFFKSIDPLATCLSSE
jgi:hypothetical protein